jgi:hypothetical protein
MLWFAGGGCRSAAHTSFGDLNRQNGAGNRKEVVRGLPMLGQGRCWIWSQGSIEPVQVQIPKKRSFHPDRRNPILAASKAAADVSGFVERLCHALDHLQAKPGPDRSHNKEPANSKLAQLELRLSQSNAEKRWGESIEEVKSQLAKAGAQILKRPNVGDREVLAIEGIKQSNNPRFSRRSRTLTPMRSSK